MLHVDVAVKSQEMHRQIRLNRLNLKFMQTLEIGVYRRLNSIANEKGITVQELIRAVILPEWMAKNGIKPAKSRATKTHRLVRCMIV